MACSPPQADLALETGLFDYPEIHEFLDGFYMSRIGIRILIGGPLHDQTCVARATGFILIGA